MASEAKGDAAGRFMDADCNSERCRLRVGGEKKQRWLVAILRQDLTHAAVRLQM